MAFQGFQAVRTGLGAVVTGAAPGRHGGKPCGDKGRVGRVLFADFFPHGIRPVNGIKGDVRNPPSAVAAYRPFPKKPAADAGTVNGGRLAVP